LREFARLEIQRMIAEEYPAPGSRMPKEVGHGVAHRAASA
jgi:hypothetical protein